ncbi:hypothetical protein ACFZB9_36905 [Kitasatospora sp. NPDC008050]|uniref:hypothetical protein n=1 Tax=Kitasatospora sp. NPDC008050 TaxID=3364021 RepID=UPI0036E7690E
MLMLHRREQAPFGSGQEPLQHFDLAASPLPQPELNRGAVFLGTDADADAPVAPAAAGSFRDSYR